MAKLIDITGKAISGEWGNDDDAGTGIPVLRTTNFTNDGVINYNNVVTRDIQKKDLSQKFLQPGDIIIEKSGGSDKQPVGRVVYYDGEPDKFLFNNFTGALRVRDKSVWYPRYVFYALYGNYAKDGTRRYENKTTGLHNLKTDQYVQDFAIQEQPLEYQRQIVSRLDKVTKLIALRKEQLAKLEQLVKSRFIEMFGDCLTNPKGWKTKCLENVAEVGSSKRVFVEELQENGIPFYRGTEVGALAEGKQITPELFITEEHYTELCEATGTPQIGDLLMPSICPDGRIWVVNTDKPFYFKDGRVLWVHAIDASYHPVFLLYTLKDRIMTDYSSIASGTTFAELKIFALKKCRVFDVPIALQNQFATFVEQTNKSKLAIQQSLDKLELLKKSLMQEYFG